MLLNNILEAIGKTPIVRFNRVGSGLACEMYGKCEFLNPGGSIKAIRVSDKVWNKISDRLR